MERYHTAITCSEISCQFCSVRVICSYQFVPCLQKSKRNEPTMSWLPHAKKQPRIQPDGENVRGPDLQSDMENADTAHPPAHEPATHELLQAIRTLSSQVGALKLEHTNLRQMVKGFSPSKNMHNTALCSQAKQR